MEPLTELPTRPDEARARIAALDEHFRGEQFPDWAREEWNQLNELVDEQNARRTRVLELAGNPRNREAGTTFHEPIGSTDPRSDALRAVEQLERSDVLSSEAGDRLTDVIDRDDALGLDRRYIAAASAPEYARAFAKLLRHGATAQLRMSPEEQEAVRAVVAVEEQRALAIGAGGTGGFAVPIEIDPTVLLTSDGQTNPVRALARVRSITTSEIRLVTSEGVTAEFSAEAAEASDDSPTLAQPVLTPERVLMFVPTSFEVAQDWPGLAAELARLFADAKDVLEGEKFVSGAGPGSNEPQGLVTGLDATSVPTGTPASLTSDDVYALQEAVPPRFQPRAQWLSANAIQNVLHRLQGGGASTERGLTSDDRSTILGKPWSEASAMDTATTTGSHPLVYGSIADAYSIADRIGLSVELVPHLFGAAQRPTGQRGFVAWYRTTGAVTVPNAARVLEVG